MLKQHPNQDRLNSLCKEFLLQLEQKPDSSQLYCLQLMLWALEAGKFQATDSRLRKTMDSLLGEEPLEACRFLKLAEDEEEYEVVQDLEEYKNPEDLAWALLDALDSKVSLHLKDYPRAKQLP